MPKAKSESTPPSILPSSFDLLSVEPIPRLVREWEKWEGFRFTFLFHFTRPEDADALRQVAQTLYDLVLDRAPGVWPSHPSPSTRWEMVAAMCELRFLEGYLRSVHREHQISSLPPEVEELSKFAGVIAHELSQIADRVNEELKKFR